MTEPRDSVTDHDLHAYVDGELEHERRGVVEAFLARHPEAAARVAAYRAQTAILRAAVGPGAPGVEDPSKAPPAPPAAGWHRRLGGAAAAGLALLLVGGAAGWWLGASQEADRAAAMVVQRAAVAHEVFGPEIGHPVDVGAEQEAHLLAWLSWRLGTPVRAPRLDGVGYALVGGRLLPGPGGPAAQFLYEDERGYRLTLYLTTRAEGGATAPPRLVTADGVSVLYWSDTRMSYALAAEIAPADLRVVARAAWEQLES